jgi:hypothetical protein
MPAAFHRVLAARRSLLRVAVGGNAFDDPDFVARLELACQILSYQYGTSAVVRADERYGNAGGILGRLVERIVDGDHNDSGVDSARHHGYQRF